jgi:SAM-dependent methyltransferase
MSDAAGWDRRYAVDDYVWKTEPNEFLPPEVEGLAPGRALDLACGEGRNAIWLATRGWQVTGVDFSQVGLDKGRALGQERGVEVEWVCADVTGFVGDEPFDLVVVFYLQVPAEQRRAALVGAARGLAPGATLLVVGHDLANLTDGVGGPQDPLVLFTPDDLVDDLATSGVDDLVVERAERVHRVVPTSGGEAVAIDCLLRARRG